ncbi:succinate-semialdehyde dehydrogenase [Fusarium verticillioides 7600]|uniref:Succinate-semialdehyde dehydrogenase n=1 Tax=Gibberella moniliformis (strain M3125 / FGSC 7600) TaxID=334819 RepID=W7M2V6_GIBM7|nr:succinate-semialdehyde dehydrogenase [Fusarium verticillioides 7600]EWG45868.1 succinate-semialdehyde dehydrogenase [Fusarium verticillioides 7600]
MQRFFKLSNPDLLHEASYVHGEWIQAASGKTFIITNPDVNNAVQSSHSGFLEYRGYTARKRAQLLLEWHRLIGESKEDLAKLVTYETGKPLAEARGEIDYSLGFAWWFAGEAERIQGTTGASSCAERRVLTIKQPIGVVVALVPWNFPIAMIMRKASAAFAAGCSMIVKPSPKTPLSCLALADLATRAGFPSGTFNVLTTSLENTPSLSEALCTHPLVAKVTFTGSTRVGKIVSGLCAQGLKKCTLELGGNCPVIVFDDADFGQAIDQIMALKTGPGADPANNFGAVTTLAGLEKAASPVKNVLENGAKLRNGSGRPLVLSSSRPRLVSLAHLTSCSSVSNLKRPQTGPNVSSLAICISCVIPVRTTGSMNWLVFIASYVFTRNSDRLWRLFENLEAGMIGLNTGNGSAAESPFGGIKQSGYGKESGKDVAVAEYLVEKTGTLTVM